ncbi:multidrug and toxin extrusion protein 1-like isoform X1 [Pseudoliparis swirei]|uniref:multidrug and toxin extrusion protein 1-like isoform X1 n=1 Tax=Pseudoliparis swirei TaxID=2059687 RepID=UPI0024BDD1EE|nr:multidrug and toxin extrusion protein 1-like isoform X1 [Pseudoliparis swirei]XP_056263698.1 multidrug and toxin extrusion protein 1-like isoform X1 [Pseudoliparis swirei]
MEKPDSPDTARPSAPGAGLADDEVPVSTAARAEGAVSSKLFRCACVRRWLPLAYREELYHVVLLTWPLLLSRILNFLQQFVISVFCGHIGNAELAGYALASAMINVTTSATGYGLSLACDTLISQTFGSGNMKRVGVILQRSSLILLLFCLPCWGLLINTQNLLLIMHQEHEVARIAHLYVMVFLPAVPAMFLHNLQVAYLQNQGIILPQLYTAAAANVVNLGVNYVLIHSLEMGVIGSAIANSLCQITICLLLYGYIRWKKLHLPTWGGWSTACLQDWGSYMKLAIPSTFMVCFEWWVWEIGGFLAGVLGEVDLAAQHVMLEIGAITFMFPLGVHAAACVRVGNALGAGNTTRAIITCKVALVLSGALAVFQGIVLVGCKSVVGYIFTSDENIVEIVSDSLTVYTFLQFFDAILCVCSGILIGAGMQKIAALSNLVGYYCIGLPVGIALMFAAKLRILGLWIGILTCVFFETGFFLFLIFKLNWKKVSYKAQLRAGKKMVVMPKRPGRTLLSEAMISDFPDTAQLDGKEAPKTEGYSPVNSQDQELKAGHEANNTNTGRAEADAESTKKTSSTKTLTLLSVTELILRRGFVFLVSVLILVSGVACHIAFPVQEASIQSRFNLTQNWTNDSSLTTLTPQDLTLKLGL